MPPYHTTQSCKYNVAFKRFVTPRKFCCFCPTKTIILRELDCARTKQYCYTNFHWTKFLYHTKNCVTFVQHMVSNKILSPPWINPPWTVRKSENGLNIYNKLVSMFMLFYAAFKHKNEGRSIMMYNDDRNTSNINCKCKQSKIK